MSLVVSIIIATKNEQVNLPRLLESLKRQTVKNFEIIVIDNFSTDATRKIARRYTPFVFSKGPERSSQRNFGARKAHGVYLLFLDADMELDANIISEIMTVAKNYVAIILPETTPGNSLFCRIKRLEKKLYANTLLEAPRFFSTAVFKQVGGYNEKLISGEDWDLGYRSAQRGRVGRIHTPISHFENSLFRELKHKWYYAKSIKNYITANRKQYREQGGVARLKLLWEKKQLLLSPPIETIGLFLLKGFEYLLYLIAQIL